MPCWTRRGNVEIELDIRKNPDYGGELFRSHALRITAALDTEKCRNIAAEGATAANVGTSRQMSCIVLPNTEKTILISTDATYFEMDAISSNGVRLSLDIDVDDSKLTDQTDKIVDAGEKLDDGAQEQLDGAQKIVDAIYETANDALAVSKGGFSKLGIAQTAQKIADPELRAQAEEAARQQIRPQVEEAARQKIRNAIASLSDEEVAALVDQQMATDAVQVQIESAVAEQMASDDVQSMIERQMQSDDVQRLISRNVEAQMASGDVQKLITQNIDEQMSSNEVHSKIEEEMEKQRGSQKYLNSVAQALEENGENGDAYRALSELREKLDDIQKYRLQGIA